MYGGVGDLLIGWAGLTCVAWFVRRQARDSFHSVGRFGLNPAYLVGHFGFDPVHAYESCLA